MTFRAGPLLLLVGCYHASPAVGLPCSESGQCPAEQVCELSASPPTCVSMLADAGVDPDVPDAAPECVDDGDCSLATQGICDLVQHVCRGCIADRECSGACSEVDGQCVPAGEAIFLAGAGVDGGMCTQASPCRTLAFGLSHLTPNRRMIVVGDGMYAAPNGTVTLNITNTGGRIVLSGTDLDPAGADLTAAPGGTSNPAVVQTGNATDIVIEGLTIKDGGNDGVRNDGALLLSRVAIRDNNGHGVSSNPGNQAALQVWDCRIANNNKQGITAQNGPFELVRSQVLRNAEGGVDLERSAATIIGSIIAGNGSTGSNYGGLSLRNLDAVQPTLAFLTIANNLASGSTVSGLLADTTVAISSSIIADNSNGAAGIVQLSVGTTATYSLFSGTAPIGTGNITGLPAFVGPTMDDFHLTSTSAALDVADPATTVRLDLDGDRRPLGSGFDIGADELPP